MHPHIPVHSGLDGGQARSPGLAGGGCRRGDHPAAGGRRLGFRLQPPRPRAVTHLPTFTVITPGVHRAGLAMQWAISNGNEASPFPLPDFFLAFSRPPRRCGRESPQVRCPLQPKTLEQEGAACSTMFAAVAPGQTPGPMTGGGRLAAWPLAQCAIPEAAPGRPAGPGGRQPAVAPGLLQALA